MSKITAQVVPYSSIVGGGVMLLNEQGRCIGQLGLMNFSQKVPDGTIPLKTYKDEYVEMCERIAAAINTGGTPVSQLKHYKSDTVYDVVAEEALFQVSEPHPSASALFGTNTKARLVVDQDPVLVYRNPDGKHFVRFPDEVVEPRFTVELQK